MPSTPSKELVPVSRPGLPAVVEEDPDPFLDAWEDLTKKSILALDYGHLEGQLRVLERERPEMSRPTEWFSYPSMEFQFDGDLISKYFDPRKDLWYQPM